MVALTALLAYPCLSLISWVHEVIQMLAFPVFSLISNATKMRSLLHRWLALSCLTAILSSSGSIHLLWLPNKQQTLESNPRHLFLQNLIYFFLTSLHSRLSSRFLSSFSCCLSQRLAIQRGRGCLFFALFSIERIWCGMSPCRVESFAYNVQHGKLKRC